MAEKTLNKEQIQAIKHSSGPLLIIAGAGTGKTTVITERIKHLIVDKNISPGSILALTFTEKAAYEMQERVDVLLPYGYSNLWIHTFHSFCDRILRDEAHQIGLDPNYKLISDSESVLLLRQNIFDLGLKMFKPLGNPTKFLDALLTHFSRLQDEDVTPEEYFRFAQTKELEARGDRSGRVPDSAQASDNRRRALAGGKRVAGSRAENETSPEAEQYLELANAYRKYEELKVKNSLMDFSDLISNTLTLFRKRPDVLALYQKQFQFILVDEFQDTNFAQNELAILLAGDNKNITVVADDDQSVYRFRGAAVSNVLQFKNNFPEAKVVTLTTNYRSNQVILDSAYLLIQNNNPNRLEVVEKIDKKLKGLREGSKNSIQLIHEKRSEDEAEEIAKNIIKLTEKDYKYSDIAILVRANNHSQGVTAALARNRIPYQFLGPGYLFQQEEIKDLIAYLTFLTNLSDSVSLFRVLSMDVFGISFIELNYLLNFAKKKNLTLFEAMSNSDLTFLKDETKEKLRKIREMVIRHLEKSKKDQAGQILYYFLVDSGLYQTLSKTESVKDERRVQNIAKFFDRIKNFEAEREYSNIYTLSEWLMLMMQLGDSPTAADVDLRDRNAVNILTVHSSKGLEFKVVFLINLVSDRFPSRERAEKIPIPAEIIKETLPKTSDFHLEEERRLFYVGMTRAKEKLFLTASDYYASAKRPRKLSSFIFEALPELKLEKPEEHSEQLSLNEVLSPYQQNEEKEEAKEPLKLSYITYSNLQMFDICPLHYKAKVIFNIPTPIAAVQSFGISMHNTFFKFYKQVMDGGKGALKDLQTILKNEWISDGYVNKKHEEERWTQAEKIVKNFYKSECNPPVKPLGLERPFSFVLKNGVKVFGKMDRIDPKGKGLPAGRQGIEIIDYKTGEDNPKAASAHELQLAIYALAATRVKDDVFNHKASEITLTLHFLESNEKKSMNFEEKDLNKLEDELIGKIKEIEKSDFRCSGSVLCANCEYKMLCQGPSGP